MKRFRLITTLSLTGILLLVVGNIWYLHSLYDTIKTQTLRTVTDCVRKADILEIINRMQETGNGQDDSFIRLTLIVQGKKREKERGYDYPNILENLNTTMSEYFHIIERSGDGLPERSYAMLDSIFKKELNSAGLYPEKVSIVPADSETGKVKGVWSVDLTLSEGQPPIYKAYFSPLNGYVLRQMSGIIAKENLPYIFDKFYRVTSGDCYEVLRR